MPTLRQYDWKAKQNEIDRWDIVKAEKVALKQYMEFFMSGGDSSKQGKNPAANIISRIDGLKIALEHLCKKEDLFNLDPSKIVHFKRSLINGNIKKTVLKRINGKMKRVATAPYTTGGIQKKMLLLKNYLEFRFRPDEKYMLVDEDERPKIEKLKERKIRYFAQKLSFNPKKVQKEWILNDRVIDKLLLRANTEWKMDYLMLQKAIGRRIGEVLQMKIKDFKLPDKKDETVHFSVPATNSKTKGVNNAPVFYIDSRDYLVKSIKAKKESGFKDDDHFICKSESAIKTWLRREGQTLLGRNIRNKDFRDYSATRITKDKKITNRFDLCDYFAWTYSSTMPDKYISRGVDWEKRAKESSDSELTDLNKKLEKSEEARILQEERFKKQRIAQSGEIQKLKSKIMDIEKFGNVAVRLFESKDLQRRILQSMIKNGLGKQLMQLADNGNS